MRLIYGSLFQLSRNSHLDHQGQVAYYEALMSTLYIFLDESGDFEFSPKGSTFFVLTSLITEDVHPITSALDTLKYSIIETVPGFRELEYFHAQNDPRPMRNEVYKLLSKINGYRVDSVAVAKHVIYPPMRPVWKFYPHMFKLLIPWVFQQMDISNYKRFIFIMDYLELQRNREAFLKGVKENVKPLLQPEQRIDAWLHRSSSHYPLQAVDYFGWAISRWYERGNSSYKRIVTHRINSDFWYYTRVSQKFY